MLLVQSGTVVKAAFFFLFFLNEGIKLWFEVGVSMLSVRLLWLSALLNGCSSLRISVKAPHRTCTPGLYSLSTMRQSRERRGLRLSWKAESERLQLSVLPLAGLRCPTFEQGLTWENLMRKCNTGAPQDVMKAVFLLTPVVSIFFR